MTGLTGQLTVLASGVAISFFFRAVQVAILARVLGLVEFGKYSTLVAIMALASRASDLGLPAAVAYHLRRDSRAFDSLYRLVWATSAAAVLPAIGVAVLSASVPNAAASALQGSTYAAGVFAVFVAANTPTWVFPSFVTASGDYRSHARLTNLDVALQALASVSACLFVEASALAVIAALAGEQILMTAVYGRFVRRYRHPETVHLPARVVLAYGLRLQWGVLMKLLTGRLDVVTIGAFRGPALAGLYAVAVSLRETGLLPLGAYASPLQNLVIDRANSPRADRRAVLASLLIHSAISLALTIAAVPVLPLLVQQLYGDAFAPAIGPAVILFSSVVFMGPAALTWVVINAKGHPGSTSALMTLTGVAGPVVTYVILTLELGLTAVAAGNVVVSCASLVASVIVLQRREKYEPADVAAAFTLAVARSADMVRRITFRGATPQ